MTNPAIGFIGLGIMGTPMAGHLLRAGHRVVAHDIVPSRVDALVAAGAEAGQSCKDVAQRCGVLISMVPDSPDVEKVYLGSDGVLDGVSAGLLLIDTSSISPVTAVKVAHAAEAKGCQMLDAPVSGGDMGAQNATLSIMVGGQPEAFERARPILELLGTPTHCGPSGAGIHAKQWTRAESKAYMNEALGDPSGRWSHEVERYIVLPAQAAGHKIGMLKILELRQQAMDVLGDGFDIKEFHNLVLGSGSVPLDILERVVEDYIDAKLGKTST
jgi:hypothetical protein